MRRITAVEELLGLALIVAGVALWSVPAAIVTAGVFLLIDASGRIARGRRKDDGDR